MAIGAPEPRTGSAYWASGAAGLGAGAEVGRIFETAKALGSLKVSSPREPDRVEVGRAQEDPAATYDAKGGSGRRAAGPLGPGAQDREAPGRLGLAAISAGGRADDLTRPGPLELRARNLGTSRPQGAGAGYPRTGSRLDLLV